MGTEAQIDARKKRLEWEAVVEAVAQVPAWCAFRWLMAQQFNEHRPIGQAQTQTKVMAGGIAEGLISDLGGRLAAPLPPGLQGSKEWKAFTFNAAGLERDRRRMLMRLLVGQRWPGASPEDREQRRKVSQLCSLMMVMQRQWNALKSGWNPLD